MKFKHYTKDKFGRETTTALVVDKPVKNKKPVKGYALFFGTKAHEIYCTGDRGILESATAPEEQELMATADTLEDLFEKFKNICSTRHENEEYNLVFDDETLDELIVAFRQKDKVRIDNPIAVVKPGKPPYKMVLVKGKRKKVVLPPKFDIFDFAVIQRMF